MGLFDIFKKSNRPYKNSATNLVYELLFCDKLELYAANYEAPVIYPWNILFSESSNIADLQEIIDDKQTESRVKVLACNKQRTLGHIINNKELYAVIVEVGLSGGLDVLASFKDGTARYINHSGNIIVMESPNKKSDVLTNKLFKQSVEVVKSIGPWDKARRPSPTGGIARITFLVSDGLYFGEGPRELLFNDPMSRSTLNSATALMKYLIDKTLESSS